MRVRILCSLALLLAPSLALAQTPAQQVPQPKLGALSPAGAKAGTSVDLRIASGTDLDGADRLLFSHPGIVATPLSEGASRLYPQGRTIEGKFKVTIAAEVPPGVYEVRAAGYFGISNARRFTVSDRDEILEKEPNQDLASAQELAPGAVVSGICDAATFDCYKVTVQKGKRYLADCRALGIDSRAQITLTLFDPAGRELARVDGGRARDPLLDFTAEQDGAYVVRVGERLYRGGDDYFYRLSVGTGPWIDYVQPPVLKPGADNAVTVYGRNLPGGTPAEGTAIDGRPLEKLAVTIAAPAAGAIAVETLLRPGDTSIDLLAWKLPGSNPVRLLLCEETIQAETEPNELPAQAQAIRAPVVVSGRFDRSGDRDGYAFDAAKGEKLWLEIVGQRLGRPLDPQLIVQQLTKSESGEWTAKDLQEIDDLATPLPQMPNNAERRYRAHSDDPGILFTAPADGRYRILVRDLNGAASDDPRLQYALIVRAPKPDFRLVALSVETSPADGKMSQVNCIVRRGGSDRLRVIAYRREGFAGAIRVEAEALPPGLKAVPAWIGPGENAADLILTAAADAPAYVGPLALVGRSEGMSRPVRSIEILFGVADMQREPVVTRVTENIGLAIDDHFVAPLSLQVPAEPLKTARGGKLKVPVKLVKNADVKDLDKASVKVVASGLPGRNNEKPIAAKELVLTLAKPDGELELDVTEKAPLGALTFHLTADVELSYVRNPERLKRAQDEQKRIDAAAAEIATEVKKTAEEKLKAEKDATAAAGEVAKLKAAGQTEAVYKQAEDKAKAADEAKAKALEADKKSQELAKAADAAKKEWAEELKKASEGAKEKKIKLFFASASMPLEIAAAPATLKPAVDSLTLKAGDKAEVAIEVTRDFGFADELKLELAGGGNAPVKLVQVVTVAGNQAQAPIVLSADKGAKPGSYTVTIRGSLKYNGKVLTIDQPLKVQIEAAAGPQ